MRWPFPQKGPITYSHDVLGNQVSASHGDGILELRMPDAVGNLFTRENRSDRVYGPSGELLESSGPAGIISYRYDREGNRIEKRQPDGGLWRYFWNAAEMLAKVKRPIARYPFPQPISRMFSFHFEKGSKPMQLVIRNVGTFGNANLRSWEPEDPTIVTELIYVSIGPRASKSADTFQIRLATPAGLDSLDDRDGIIATRPLLVMRRYSYDDFWRWLEHTLTKCEADTWLAWFEKLRRYFDWEYEGYETR